MSPYRRATPPPPRMPLRAMFQNPKDAVAALVLARHPEACGEPFNASTMRRFTGLEVCDGDVVTWEFAEKVRDVTGDP